MYSQRSYIALVARGCRLSKYYSFRTFHRTSRRDRIMQRGCRTQQLFQRPLLECDRICSVIVSEDLIGCGRFQLPNYGLEAMCNAQQCLAPEYS